MLYELIPTMPEVRLLPLIERFATMLAELPVFAYFRGHLKMRGVVSPIPATPYSICSELREMDAVPVFLRHKDAAQYLRQKYGFSSEKSLAQNFDASAKVNDALARARNCRPRDTSMMSKSSETKYNNSRKRCAVASTTDWRLENSARIASRGCLLGTATRAFSVSSIAGRCRSRCG